MAVVDSAEVEQASAEMKVLHLSGVGRLVANMETEADKTEEQARLGQQN